MSKKKVVKEEKCFKVWITIEEQTRTTYDDGTEDVDYEDTEETNSAGMFLTLEEAVEQMELISDVNINSGNTQSF